MDVPALHHSVIDAIFAMTGMPDGLLHAHAGMAIMLGSAVVLRRSLSSWVPISIVIAAEVVNETLNRMLFGSWRPMDTGLDMFNTIVWPVALFLYSRWRRYQAAERVLERRLTLGRALAAQRKADMQEARRSLHALEKAA